MKGVTIKVDFGGEYTIFRIHPELRRRFKAVCEAEGVSMSDKIREWVVLYTHEHEKGNPQLLLFPREEKSLLAQVLEEKTMQEFPMTRVRREVIGELVNFIKRYPDMSQPQVVMRFALLHGFTVDKIREYMRLLDSQVRR